MTNIEKILDQKPFTKKQAIIYADELANKYNKMYCVVTFKNTKGCVIISINYFKHHIHRYILHYIT